MTVVKNAARRGNLARRAGFAILGMCLTLPGILQASRGIVPDPEKDWAIQKVERPAVPEVTRKAWVRNPIDAFILHRMEAKGLSPNPAADKRTLLRRTSYDLTGLPPTEALTRQFLDSNDPEAYSQLIQALLDSPHYGEQWGRHWLDCVRYGESNSYERDNPKPEVWRYRDYVIQSFNKDKPFDQFVLEQLAGDELDEVTSETITATGYYRLGIWDDEPTDRLQARYDGLDDIVATTSQVFLGMTINCARCHDHKIDPIPQTDYYSMMAFFHNVRHYDNGGNVLTDIPSQKDRDEREARVRELEGKKKAANDIIKAMESKILKVAQGEPSIEETDPKRRAKLLGDFRDKVLSEEEKKTYNETRQKLERLNKTKMPKWPRALSVKEHGRNAPETFVLYRGNAHVKRDKVEPAFPEALGFPKPTLPSPPKDAQSSGRRRVLAEWIASPDNPLTARVMVNRIWHYHFGRGIVASPNDFGRLGMKPSHPELLDWLAAEFMASGWSIKAMHRLIMDSNTYRLASTSREAMAVKDPDNQLYWRSNIRRLRAEEIRDSILTVNGQINLAQGGPSIYPEMPREVLATQSRPGANWRTSNERDQARRSVYIHVKRSLHHPFLTIFDLADPDTPCPVRFSTTQPTQALTMLNSKFINTEAARFAERLQKEAGPAPRDQVRLGLKHALNRKPSKAEIERGVRLMTMLTEEEKMKEKEALTQFCLAVYNLNEFIFID